MVDEKIPGKLTKKQEVFVEAFLSCWNATKAAGIAGYARPNQSQYGIINSPAVANAIQTRLDQMALKANEVIARLCEQATVNPADFYEFETLPNGKVDFAGVNWGEIKRRGHLIKRITYNRQGEPVLEFHDAQNALIMIGKYLKLFQEQVGVEFLSALKGYVSVSPDDWDKENPESSK